MLATQQVLPPKKPEEQVLMEAAIYQAQAEKTPQASFKQKPILSQKAIRPEIQQAIKLLPYGVIQYISGLHHA
ncbi:hypothetical protein C1N53_22130 [Pontibacter sp. SGAir0037]|nr:hypothetical protein C1N53_22130 [Pontibacter sp. SGAir0037]